MTCSGCCTPAASRQRADRSGSPIPRGAAERGFTLIELMVVIVILSMAMMLVFPRLPSTEAGNLRSSARSLASTFRYLGDRAVATRTHYRMHFNFRDGSITIARVSGGEEAAADDPLLGKNPLRSGVSLQDVQIPRLGTVTEGEVIIDFGPAGQEELTTVHLRSGAGATMTVTAFPHSGKVVLAEGYQEVKL